jgi:hypothetical protein
MRKIRVLTLLLACFCAGDGITAEKQTAAAPNADLQAILDRGDDLLLKTGQVYRVKQVLKFKKPGQRIATLGATHISDYATLRLDDKEFAQLVNGNGQSNAVLEQVILDGNRYALSHVGPVPENGNALVHFGGHKADGQIVRNCVFMNLRSWSMLKLHEGAKGCRVEANILLGAGADIRGNGRDGRERAPAWGDGISCAARDSIVRDNLIIDPTDGAVVVFAAQGSIIEENVIAAVSRESLGGVNLVDPIGYYHEAGSTNHTSYAGTTVRNNLFDVFGARIHIVLPIGAPIWAPRTMGQILTQGTVINNVLQGDAGGYGLVANYIDDFVITGNVSRAKYSGIGEGRSPTLPPDEPGPFLYNADEIGKSVLQCEFKKSERHLLHLLRCNHQKLNMLGYRFYEYGQYEGPAVVRSAYLEMLGRQPTAEELAYSLSWLNNAKANADELRRILMASPEFTSKYGFVPPEELHPYRVKLWFNNLDQIRRAYFEKYGTFPSAKAMYEQSLLKLNRSSL